ncbi:MAG: hypothetical protein ACI8WB_005577, partial [Phenylobacterium sp.]
NIKLGTRQLLAQIHRQFTRLIPFLRAFDCFSNLV